MVFHFFETEKEKRYRIDVVAFKEKSRRRLCRSISDAACGRKRKARGVVFSASVLNAFRRATPAHSDYQKRAREQQEAKTWLLAYSSEGRMIFNNWRCPDLKVLSIPGGRHFPVHSPI